MTRNNLIRLAAVAMLGLLASLGVVHASGGHGVQPTSVEGSAKADRLESCVRDTPFMRRSHFELIKHQRDVTVHQGIRKTDDSLSGCVACHAGKDASGEFVPVNAPGEFCAGCHEYTATTLDCFSCHAAVPTSDDSGLHAQIRANLDSLDPAQVERAHAGLDLGEGASDKAQVMGN